MRFRQLWLVPALVAMAALVPHPALAQTTPVVRAPIYEGECVVSLSMVAAAASPSAATLEVKVNEESVDLKGAKVTSDNGVVAVWLGDSFRRGDKVRARTLPDGQWSQTVEAVPSSSNVRCTQPTTQAIDERPRIASVVLIGGSSETFAPETERFQKDVAGVTGVTAADRTKHLQLMTEFSLDYRLAAKGRRALWLLTRARYFAQQTSTCTTGSTEAALCVENDVSIKPNQAFKNVNNARVAEFVFGARYEFATLNPDDTPVAVYGSFTYGSLFVGKFEIPSGGVDTAVKTYDKALNDHLAAIGISVTKGRFRDTFVETGAGITEIFAPDSGSPAFKRWKTNAMLVTDGSVLKFWDPIRFFVRFSLDRALGPDSYRTSYGGIVDLSRVFGGLGDQ